MDKGRYNTGMDGMGSLHRYVTQAIESANTAFDRLVFIGSLRDAYTGRYLHEGWERISSEKEVHDVLRQLHLSTFESVLHLSVIGLSKELRFHFQSLNQPERDTSLIWLELEAFRDLIPQGCSPVLRELFLSQIRTALEVLCRAPDWSELEGPVASQRLRPDQSLPPHWIN